MSNFTIWLLASRPKTLVTAVAPVFIGSAIAFHENQWLAAPAFICLAFALLIQIGTNWANDYYDYIKGADNAERKGPRRMVASGLICPSTMKKAMIGVFAAAFGTGCALVPYGGWIFIVLGLICILCGIAYTGGPFPIGYNGLGDLFVFVFFGLVAVNFTFYLQAGYFSWNAFIVSFAPGALATNLLVVNNYRDKETDARAGKKTLVVRLGRKAAWYQYAISLFLAFIIPPLLWAKEFSFWIVLPLILIPKGFRLIEQLKFAQSPANFSKVLEGTALFLTLYSLLIIPGLIF